MSEEKPGKLKIQEYTYNLEWDELNNYKIPVVCVHCGHRMGWAKKESEIDQVCTDCLDW